jgi:hypothetical protein
MRRPRPKYRPSFWLPSRKRKTTPYSSLTPTCPFWPLTHSQPTLLSFSEIRFLTFSSNPDSYKFSNQPQSTLLRYAIDDSWEFGQYNILQIITIRFTLFPTNASKAGPFERIFFYVRSRTRTDAGERGECLLRERWMWMC